MDLKLEPPKFGDGKCRTCGLDLDICQRENDEEITSLSNAHQTARYWQSRCNEFEFHASIYAMLFYWAALTMLVVLVEVNFPTKL
jgi:hypothetical protein